MCTVNGFGRHRARPGAAPFGHEQQEPDTSQWRTCEIAYLESRIDVPNVFSLLLLGSVLGDAVSAVHLAAELRVEGLDAAQNGKHLQRGAH